MNPTVARWARRLALMTAGGVAAIIAVPYAAEAWSRHQERRDARAAELEADCGCRD